MTTAARILALSLLIAGSAAAEVAPAVSDGSDGVVLQHEELARLIARARARIERIDAGTESAASIEAEIDAVLREAMWSLWLDDLVQRDRLGPDAVAALKALVDFEPVARQVHHEMAHRAVPAFRVAPRAEALLERERLRSRAARLAREPERALAALAGASADPDRFRAAVAALPDLPIAERRGAAEALGQRAERDPDAARAVIELYRADPMRAAALVPVVAEADPTIARAALRAALEYRPVDLMSVATAALSRTDLDGLGVAAWAAAGGDVDAVCWALLADPQRGLDAARALASGSTRLVSTIRSRIAGADPVARRRMLLALSLRDSGPARALLAELVAAQWLTDRQRAELAEWLE